MPDAPDPERLKALDARIRAAKGTPQVPPEEPAQGRFGQAQLLWRMTTELVVGIGIGFGIGYGLDGVLGTRPVLMVVFTLLGLAAGVRTMLRSAREVQEEREEIDRRSSAEGKPGSKPDR